MLLGDNKSPHTETWDFIIDQRVFWNSTLEVQYTGNRSRDLLLSSNGGGGVQINNINFIPVGGLFKPDPVTGITYYCQGTPDPASCVPDAPPSSAIPHYKPYAFNNLYLSRHGSYSNYNGLVIQWLKQAGPVVFNVNYTFSKTMGIRDGNNNNGQGSGAALDGFTLKNNYGPLAFNRTHIFNAAYVINLPSPVHNAFAGQFVNGWQISGVVQYQSGPPLQPLTGTGLNPSYPGGTNNQSILGTNGIALEPYLTCNPAKGLSSGQYFNPTCFQAPTTRGQNGPLIWPNITGPGYVGSDLGVYKNFKLRKENESQRIQFRFTAFNFLNHANPRFGLSDDVNLRFSAPGGGNTNPHTNGKPAYKVGNRTLEFALKFLF
jgi:hypothetical protein